VIITGERMGQSPGELMSQVMAIVSDQEVALSAVSLTELVHGIYRADSLQLRVRRKLFLDELQTGLIVYPYTAETANVAGQIDGEQTSKGVIIPFVDLMIGATAISLGYSVLTTNLRHFQMIPGLKVISA
jgi:tRNA(fMet)-specific endonuclease VapC